MAFDEHYALREEMVRELEDDLVGPRASDEILTEAPLYSYVAGILFPKPPAAAENVAATVGSGDEPEDVAESSDEGGTVEDPPVASTNVRYPSSMGMTFAVDPRLAALLTVTCSAARYVLESDQGEATEVEPEPDPLDGYPSRRGRAPSDERWRRDARGPFQVDVDASHTSDRYVDLEPGLQLYVRVRPADRSGAVSITTALVNTLEVKPGMYRDDASYFQVHIGVEAQGGVSAFIERQTGALHANDADLESYRLLYRATRSFAVGHGCSVRWEAGEDGAHARLIETTFVPTWEVLSMQSNPVIETATLDMHFLATAEPAQIIAALEELVTGYEGWITRLREAAAALPDEFASAASRHISDCGAVASRMRNGIALLERDAVAWRAFQLMNLAMGRQRARVAWIRAGKPGPEPATPDARWFPFQIGFILLSLAGITDETSTERDVADLLWFPTGGGKTEAYLGLIAYTIFLRRLKRQRDVEGVTALMRYTLRLLTIQQFERATALICECEALRRGDDSLGAAPISIGLWLGRAGTPNTLDEASKALRELSTGRPLERMNPVQLQRCSWCGEDLDHTNYVVKTGPRRLVIQCRQDSCAFRDGLPAHVVDEDLYRERPTLLIATVDKFARLPWRRFSWGNDVEALFGESDAGRALPVQLIIQDELHLISGPLGTLMGLYETAVDSLSTRDGSRPKVIASTATVRGASDQTQALFARSFSQFPPPGIDFRDSYFAVEAPKQERGSRRYVGLMSAAVSHSTLMIRVYASLLQSAKDLLPDTSNEVRDTFWTLLGYFNSLRVLASARIQVMDDVVDRLGRLNRGDPRSTSSMGELTSRESSAEIPRLLDQMFKSYPSAEAFDVVLATNMISVGVDISRLGLMVVMGQPQATAEYIQATSRVGRSSPGLVVAVLNSSRSRDISHFESFPGFHSALYRQVEASTVTPFSPRARDRGLHAVLIAMARLVIAELRGVDQGRAILDPKTRAEVDKVAEDIVKRVSVVAPAAAKDVHDELMTRIDDWERFAGGHEEGLRFRRPYTYDFRTNKYAETRVPSVLIQPTEEPSDEGLFPTLQSLRDVDETTDLSL